MQDYLKEKNTDPLSMGEWNWYSEGDLDGISINNKCIVIPEWNMVVVRMGEDGHPENQDIVSGTFLKLLGMSILDKN